MRNKRESATLDTGIAVSMLGGRLHRAYVPSRQPGHSLTEKCSKLGVYQSEMLSLWGCRSGQEGRVMSEAGESSCSWEPWRL